MKKLITICAVVVMLASAWTASASYTITHTHSQGIGYENASFNGGNSYVSSYLGRFVMSVASSTTLPASYPVYTYLDHPYSFFSYCLEPTQNIGVGHNATYTDFTIGSLAGTDGISAAEAGLIRELFGRYSPLLSVDPTGPYTGGTFRTAAAALQLALWEINLDTGNGWNLSAGNMRVIGTPITEGDASLSANAVALLMLNSLDGTGPMALGLEGLRSSQAQDLIIQGVVPVPGAILLGGIGVGLVGWLKKRRTL